MSTDESLDALVMLVKLTLCASTNVLLSRSSYNVNVVDSGDFTPFDIGSDKRESIDGKNTFGHQQ